MLTFAANYYQYGNKDRSVFAERANNSLVP